MDFTILIESWRGDADREYIIQALGKMRSTWGGELAATTLNCQACAQQNPMFSNRKPFIAYRTSTTDVLALRRELIEAIWVIPNRFRHLIFVIDGKIGLWSERRYYEACK